MTPSDADTPLTAIELAVLRGTIEEKAARGGTIAAKNAARLLATLDATRAAPGLREWAANGLAALDHLDSLYYAGEPGGVTVADYRAATDAIRAALSQPDATAGIDATWLAMAMDIAQDTPILGTGLRRVDVVLREYARLTASGKPA